jgi:hypothetical protein
MILYNYCSLQLYFSTLTGVLFVTIYDDKFYLKYFSILNPSNLRTL